MVSSVRGRVRSAIAGEGPLVPRVIALVALAYLATAGALLLSQVSPLVVPSFAGPGIWAILAPIGLLYLLGWFSFRWYDEHGPGALPRADRLGLVGAELGAVGLVLALPLPLAGFPVAIAGFGCLCLGVAWQNYRYAVDVYGPD